MPTANDQNSVMPYTGTYAYGNQMGWYGSHLTDQNVGQLAYNSGARTVRPSLESTLIDGAGVDARKDAFAYYKQIGLIDLTAFVGNPHSSVRDTIKFPNCPESAKTFKGMYLDIWSNVATKTVNPNNTLAAYIYKTVNSQNYRNVKFFEVVNEPDLCYTPSGWDANNPTYGWNKVNPSPAELPNLYAPIFYYVRMLRVAYEVIKAIRPDAYVCTGGLGYASFLDAICRNTDNPTDGSVTAAYPLKGGAYFDVLSYHDYPSLGEWNVYNSTRQPNGWDYFHHSDGAIKCLIDKHNSFKTVLEKFGYNGTTYPKKLWLNTETDVNRIPAKDGAGNMAYGSIDLQNNFTVKMHVIAQKLGISQFYKYGMGDGQDSGLEIFNYMGVYGNLKPSTTTVANAPKNDNFYVAEYLTKTLYGKPYDAVKTATLNIPASCEGAAFKNLDGTYIYVLWAKTDVNESETPKVLPTFSIAGFKGKRYNLKGATEVDNGILLGSPSFFVEDTVVIPQPPTPKVIIEILDNNTWRYKA